MPEPPPQQTQSQKPPVQPPHHGPEHRGRPWKVEGGRTPPPAPGTPPPAGTPQPFGRRLLWILLALLALNWVVASLLQDTQPRATVPYSFFRDQALVGNIKEVSSKGETIKGEFRRETRYPPDDGRTTRYFETERPAFADDEILDLLLRKDVEISAKAPDEGSLLATFLVGLVPTLLIVGLLVFAMRRAAMAQGGGMLGNLGKSKARRYDASQTRVTFADVAGIDEATEELAEVVDFLRHPERYRRLGGTIPHGVLLTGPPGTGKTLLARALAGEAAVPFYSLSASEFVEMIVGVGASRVRDLFEHAKQDAPSIIFIDELDAIGRVRGAGNLGGGSDEREQTLNQLLTEMDGFDGSEGVVVVSATNRPEILDPALLRAGRFDRRVAVNPPDQDGRRRILEVHTRSVPLADDVDLGAIASTTPGMVGADLRNLVNEAALHAARRDSAVVQRHDFTDALEKIVLGTARRIVLSYEDRRLTAYHESGHALLGMLEPGADPVRKVSIIPRGSAMGVTFQSPEADRYGYTAGYLRGRIVGALGGRAAEELVFGEVTTGAESDLEQATALARQMVGRWGMSDALGLVSVLPGPGQEGIVLPGSPSANSERTRELVDAEVRRIIDACYQQALQRLREHREQLDALAAALLEHETLDEADAYRVAGLPHEPAPVRPSPVPEPRV